MISIYSNDAKLKPGLVGVIVVFLVFMAVTLRALAIEEIRPMLNLYLGVGLTYFILFIVLLFLPGIPEWLKHLILVLQSVVVLLALSWRPEFDFLVNLFLLLTYAISITFTGRMRGVWVLIMVLLTGGSLIFFLGLIRGLALSLVTIAGEAIIPIFLIANHEIETSSIKSQALLSELQKAHKQLETYVAQVEDLTAVQERNRLARELHDTVSQFIFSINLTTRSVQLLLKTDPSRVPEHLNRLQEMTTSALGQLRSLITQLRPVQNPDTK